MKDFFSVLHKNIKLIFSDIFILYKNFLHWNLSKIIIYIFSILFGFLSTLPFLIWMLILGAVSSVDWAGIFIGGSELSTATFIHEFSLHPFIIILEILLFFFAFIVHFVMFSYGSFLIAKVNIEYLNKNKLAFFSNFFLKFGYIKTFIFIFIRRITYSFFPVLLFIVASLLLLFLFTFIGFDLETKGIPFYLLSTLIFASFVFFSVWFLKRSYEVSFSHIILAHKGDLNNNAKSYINESIKTSSKKIKYFIPIFIVFGLILLPFFYIENKIKDNLEDRKNYISYTGRTDLNKKQQIVFNKLSIKFSKLDLKQMKKSYKNYTNLDRVFDLFSFLFIGKLVDMLFVSFYLRIILIESNSKKNKTLKLN